jgi:hypothetical protein
METSPLDPRRIDVWEAMSEHFLDTETRENIPWTALQCVKAGFSPEEARAIWRCEVAPALWSNLGVAPGVWAGWDRDWLVRHITSQLRGVSNLFGLRPCLYARFGVRWPFGTWCAIERCMHLILEKPTPAEREELARDLRIIANQAFGFTFAKSFLDLEPADRIRACALYPDPFREALAPAMLPGEGRVAHQRVCAALAACYVR